jgi:hypothetical protein
MNIDGGRNGAGGSFLRGFGGDPTPPAGEEASPDPCNGLVYGGGHLCVMGYFLLVRGLLQDGSGMGVR